MPPLWAPQCRTPAGPSHAYRLKEGEPSLRGGSMGDQGSARWECELCGEQHEGLATVFGAQAPDPWLQAAPAEREDGELTPDVCVLKIDGEWHYFMRGHIEIPLTDLPGDRFAWSAWVSLSETSMKLAVDHWDGPERGNLAPMFGWLCNELPYGKSKLS